MVRRVLIVCEVIWSSSSFVCSKRCHKSLIFSVDCMNRVSTLEGVAWGGGRGHQIELWFPIGGTKGTWTGEVLVNGVGWPLEFIVPVIGIAQNRPWKKWNRLVGNTKGWSMTIRKGVLVVYLPIDPSLHVHLSCQGCILLWLILTKVPSCERVFFSCKS